MYVHNIDPVVVDKFAQSSDPPELPRALSVEADGRDRGRSQLFNQMVLSGQEVCRSDVELIPVDGASEGHEQALRSAGTETFGQPENAYWPRHGIEEYACIAGVM